MADNELQTADVDPLGPKNAPGGVDAPVEFDSGANIPDGAEVVVTPPPIPEPPIGAPGDDIFNGELGKGISDDDPYGNQTDKTPTAFHQQRLIEAGMATQNSSTRDRNLSAAEKDKKEQDRAQFATRLALDTQARAAFDYHAEEFDNIFNDKNMRDEDKRRELKQQEIELRDKLRAQGKTKEEIDAIVAKWKDTVQFDEKMAIIEARIEAAQKMVAEQTVAFARAKSDDFSLDEAEQSLLEQEQLLKDIEDIIAECGTSPELQEALERQQAIVSLYNDFVGSGGVLNSNMQTELTSFYGGHEELRSALQDAGIKDADLARLKQIQEQVEKNEDALAAERSTLKDQGITRASSLDHWDKGLAKGKSVDYYIFEGELIEEGGGDPYYVLHGTNWTADDTSIKITAESHLDLYKEILEKHAAGAIQVADSNASASYLNAANSLTAQQLLKDVQLLKADILSTSPDEIIIDNETKTCAAPDKDLGNQLDDLVSGDSKLDNLIISNSFRMAAAAAPDAPTNDPDLGYHGPNAGR